MKTTFSRAFFPAAIVLLAALLLVGTVLRLMVGTYLQDQAVSALENDGKAISSLASAYYSSSGYAKKDFLVNLSVASQVSDADAVIFNAQGTVLLCSDEPFGCQHQSMQIEEAYVKRVLEQGKAVDRGIFPGLYEDSRFVVSTPILHGLTGEAVGFVMVSTPTRDATAILKRITDIYLTVSLLVVLVAVLIMSLFAGKQSKPLKEMAKVASRFGHGDLDARVNLENAYTRETEELALAFNNMASSLQKSEYQRQEFVANVSHELKTPMTTIGGYIDGILDGTIPPERAEHYMQIVSDETKRLSRLVRSMLDISRLQDQGGIPEEKKTRFEIQECAGQVLLSFEKKITDKKLDVQVEFPEHPIYVFAQQDSITQVIYNLLDNAVKFCPQQGQLGVKIVSSGAKAYITVSNTGQTIPPEELPLVFDRFHKMDKSRSQNRDGWGLGLYIVKTLVCSHGEDISVTSQSGKTAFTFTLPIRR